MVIIAKSAPLVKNFFSFLGKRGKALFFCPFDPYNGNRIRIHRRAGACSRRVNVTNSPELCSKRTLSAGTARRPFPTQNLSDLTVGAGSPGPKGSHIKSASLGREARPLHSRLEFCRYALLRKARYIALRFDIFALQIRYDIALLGRYRDEGDNPC